MARTRSYQVGALLIAVIAIAAVLIAVFTSHSTSELAPGKPVPGASQALALLAGIPQRGDALGNPHAPLTLVEFGDLQCPACAAFAQEILPAIVSRYVRTGRVLLVFRALHYIGHDSLRAARMAGALGEQDHLWEFIEEMYANQESENTGYVTDTYLRALTAAIPGVDVARALSDRNSPAVETQIEQSQAQFKQLHFAATPSFLISHTGRPARIFSPASLSTSSAFTGPLDRMLSSKAE